MTVLLAGTLLIAENVFINTGLRVLINMQPDRTRITWSRALTIVPGEVEVWDLAIRVQDARAQWLLEADHASGVIDLAALTEYRFSAHALRGEGGRFLLRVRRDTPREAGGPDATPPIEGFENPPVLSPEVAYGPPARLFRIELEDLVVEHVRELWLEDYRFVGDAQVSGGVELLHDAWLEVKDLKLAVASGSVNLGEEPIASAIEGQIDLALRGVNPADYEGTGLLRAVTARVSLAAQVQDLRFLSFYLRKAPWLKLSGGEGSIELDVAIDEGRFVEGSRLGINAKALVARFRSYAVTGDGNVRVEVVPLPTGAEGQLSVEFFDYGITKWGDTAAHALGTGLRVEARTTSLSLDEPFETLNVSLDVPDSAIPDAGVYNDYLPSDLGFSLLSGKGRVHGKLEASTADNVARGDLYLTATGVNARSGELNISGKVALHAHLASGNLATGRYDMSGTKLELRDVRVVGPANGRAGKDDSRDWWAEVTVPRGKIEVGAPVFLDARVKLSCRDSVPFVTIFSQANPLPGWARGLLHIRDLSGEADLLLGDDTLFIPTFLLRGGDTELRMQLRRKLKLFNGSLYVRYGALSLGMGLKGKESELHLFKALEWYTAQPPP